MAAIMYGFVLILLPCLNVAKVNNPSNYPMIMKLLNALQEDVRTRNENYPADADVQHTEVDLRAGAQHCGKPADVMFVIDSSSSIWIYDFEKQIKFVQELVKMFDIGPNTTRVAALTFSQNVRIEFRFNEFDTADKVVQREDQLCAEIGISIQSCPSVTRFKTIRKDNSVWRLESVFRVVPHSRIQVGKIVHANGLSTFTHEALKVMRSEMFSTTNGARSDVPKICILLTDGQSTYGTQTLQEATLAKQQSIKILAIGIGNKVKDAELEAVVSPPAKANYFKSGTFDKLQSPEFQELVGQKACEAIETTTAPTTSSTSTTTKTTKATTPTTTQPSGDRPEQICQGKEADVVIIVDMSSSIWVEDFKSQLRFLSDLISHFDIDSGKTRVGMIAFSDNATIQFYLNDYKTRVDVSKAILRVQSDGGITNTHLALQKLLNEMLTSQHGSRPSVAHICIIITDGISSKPDSTASQAQLVHDSGVYVFSIGVGNMTDKAELELLASKPEFAFEVNGYSALPKIQDILTYKTCEVPQGDSLKCSQNVQADIIFGLYCIGAGDRGNAAEFVKSVGGAFDLVSGNVRIGLRESCGRAELPLSEFENKNAFISSVNDAMKADMSSLIYDARTALGPTRPNADKVVILVISGEVPDMENAYTEAMRLKAKARVFVVGIGNRVNLDQLKRLASYKNRFDPDNSHVFPVEDSENLAFVVKKLQVLMCGEQK